MRGAWMCGVVVAAVWLGCNASGTTSGGSLTSTDACAATGNDHTWTALYTCYFGPGAKTSCVGQDFCHGGPEMTGTLNPPYYVCGTTRESCYEGFVKAFSGCPDGGVADAESDAPAEGSASPTPDAGRCTVGIQPYAYFFGDARGSSVTGFHNMPYSATASQNPYASGSTGASFTQADLDRIQAWINDGAQDN
jgi:hypothetical protein